MALAVQNHLPRSYRSADTFAPPPSVTLLSGAGVSTSSGIPDFRSAGGMYDTLRPELLTATEQQRKMMKLEPTAVVSWDIFKNNQLPYLELRRPFILEGNSWKPTLFHVFAKILDVKKLLKRSYTQNIDGLDHKVGLPRSKLINVHGSMAEVACEVCKAPYPIEDFRKKVKENIKDIYNPSSQPSKSTPIQCLSCGSPHVKPTTVLYGRELPPEFSELSQSDVDNSHLIMIFGTSLTVFPAAGLPDLASPPKPRVIVNRDYEPGETSVDPEANETDFIITGDCDSVILDIVEAAGWMEEMERFKDVLCDKSKELLKCRLTKGKGR
eukprot:CAMPEP_0118658364 /NCGR_PEP_ID=MMETSP0785-20121206/14527_1 /TAXON_ID=91992 /ORGANISM="Bolidomonas pacifica, Strain CCMP 1866" /LENGTH=324 /DNA_ID=CAMNT_0006551373 /DNA_START=175 /DNA_END=1148 /DNA_ORIENTATION=-